jgi:hypothetical protein
MKHFFILSALVFAAFIPSANAADLQFGTTVYYTSSDSTAASGAVLTSSGTTLSGFDFSTVPLSHPIFHGGIYFPVTDCLQKNLWVRLRHTAADPNGTVNGQNIQNTTGIMFQAGTNVLGGWNGFRFTLEIYRDQNLTGTRADVLAGLSPTTITVSSLETLCCPGGPYEWLSFEILNPESSGWNLNSINFTGNNPGSAPGFCSYPVYVDPANSSFRPPQFISQFPTGSDSVYAITLTTGGYSEFRMTANNVSRFQYGYEFFSWGYQGMSMSFGEGPAVADSTVPELCSGQGGSIYLQPSGLGPYQVSWNNGSTAQNLIGAAPGTYTATVTDGSGCSSQITRTISPAPPFSFNVALASGPSSQFLVLVPVISGGTGAWTYLWNTGSVNDSLLVQQNGTYTLQITDTLNGCVFTDSLQITQFTGISSPEAAQALQIRLEADGSILLVSGLLPSEEAEISDVNGRKMSVPVSRQASGQIRFQVNGLPKGQYFLHTAGSSRRLSRKILIQ